MIKGISAYDGFVPVRLGSSIKDQHFRPRTVASRLDLTASSVLVFTSHTSTMQLSNNFSRMALFVLALASVGTTTPLAAVSDALTGAQVVYPS